MPSIKDQHVLVIGGSSGIGFAVAQLALTAGAKVVVVSSNSSRVEDAVNRLKTSFPGSQVKGYDCDLSGSDLETRLEKLLNTITSNGSILLDHIVYTAARAPAAKPLQETTYEDIVKATQNFFTAPLLITKLASRFMKEGPTSSLTFTGGHVSHKPIPNYTVFTAGAAGLIGMTRNLALDMAPRRVNLVSPGSTMTEMWGPDRAQYGAMMAKKALLGKVGAPDEVAEAYIYLMRDSNATGSCVNSEGGSLLQFIDYYSQAAS